MKELSQQELENLKEVLRDTKMTLHSGLRRAKFTEFQIMGMDEQDIRYALNNDGFVECLDCSVWCEPAFSDRCETCQELDEIEDFEGPFS